MIVFIILFILILVLSNFSSSNKEILKSIHNKTTEIKIETLKEKYENGMSTICSFNSVVYSTCLDKDDDYKEKIVADNVSLREFVRDKKDLSLIYTAKVSDMSFLFFNDKEFNDENILSWNVSNVSNMNYMFFGASSFNQNLGAWDIYNVKYFRGFLKHASSFDQNLVWGLDGVKDKKDMFDKKKNEELLVLEGDNFIVSLGSYKGHKR